MATARGEQRPPRRRDRARGDTGGRDLGGFGMVGVVMSLAVVSVLGVVAVAALGGNPVSSVSVPNLGGTGGASPPGAGGVIATAADTVAQQNLGTALSVADQTALSAGDYGNLDAAALVGAGSGVDFTSAASTSAAQVSVGVGGNGVTMATRSASGTCWFAWRSSATTWYGVEKGQLSCPAPALTGTPATGTGGIRWQQGAFPSP
jgi:hypothetical protein